MTPVPSPARGATGASWSVQARRLPFIEQENLHNLIDFNLPYASQPLVTRFRVPIYLCPSEVNDRPRVDGALTHYPLNYAANAGTWHIYHPASGAGGDGAFSVNLRLRPAEFADGLSNTLAFAEVKAYTPYVRDGGSPAAANASLPASPSAVAALPGEFKADSGHTEWVDARVHQTGFTTTFAPNTPVPFTSGVRHDIDFNSSREGQTTNRITYAAVTARSYHAGLVNVLLMDGSVRSVSRGIRVDVWRALGTRAGGEVVGDY